MTVLNGLLAAEISCRHNAALKGRQASLFIKCVVQLGEVEWLMGSRGGCALM